MRWDLICVLLESQVSSLAMCSDLLDEDADPLEVLPNSAISGPLFLLFRVLYADWDAFKSWADLDGGRLLCVGALCCCCRLCDAAVNWRGSKTACGLCWPAQA